MNNHAVELRNLKMLCKEARNTPHGRFSLDTVIREHDYTLIQPQWYRRDTSTDAEHLFLTHLGRRKGTHYVRVPAVHKEQFEYEARETYNHPLHHSDTNAMIGMIVTGIGVMVRDNLDLTHKMLIVAGGGLAGYLYGQWATSDERREWKKSTKEMLSYFSADRTDGRRMIRTRRTYNLKPIAVALDYISAESLTPLFSSTERI